MHTLMLSMAVMVTATKLIFNSIIIGGTNQEDIWLIILGDLLFSLLISAFHLCGINAVLYFIYSFFVVSKVHP